jgi:hypothetical protein
MYTVYTYKCMVLANPKHILYQPSNSDHQLVSPTKFKPFELYP